MFYSRPIEVHTFTNIRKPYNIHLAIHNPNFFDTTHQSSVSRYSKIHDKRNYLPTNSSSPLPESALTQYREREERRIRGVHGFPVRARERERGNFEARSLAPASDDQSVPPDLSAPCIHTYNGSFHPDHRKRAHPAANSISRVSQRGRENNPSSFLLSSGICVLRAFSRRIEQRVPWRM